MPMSSKAAHDSRQRSSKATEISTLHADVKQGCPRFKAKKFQGNRDLHPACRCQARLPTIQGKEVPRQQRSPPCMPMSSEAAHDSRQRSSKATEISTLHADVKQGCPRFKAAKFQGNRDIHLFEHSLVAKTAPTRTRARNSLLLSWGAKFW